jgi:putative transposase
MERSGVPATQSDKTFRRWLIDWKNRNYDVWQLCRYGEKRLNDVVLPYIQRDYSAIEVGDIVVADGHVLNFEIINPFTGKPKRMTLIVLFDMKSNYPLGWEIMPTENVSAIAAAFRRGILRLGFVPRVFYLDNGKAFRAKYFKGVTDFKQAGLTGLFERLNCKVIHAWAYHGQSKTVERMFGSFGEMERLAPTYTGTSIAHKPARMMRNEKWHLKMWQRVTGGATPTLEEAHWMIAMWFAQYVNRKQQDGHLKGYSPAEVFEAGVERVRHSDDFALRVKSKAELAYLMMSQKVTKLYRNGIRFNNRYYYNEALFPFSKERDANHFVIHYDMEDPDSVLVFSEAGEFVCEAYCTDKVHPAAAYLGTSDDVAALQRQIEHKRHLAKDVKKTARVFFDSVADDLQRLPEAPQVKRQAVKAVEDPPAVEVGNVFVDDTQEERIVLPRSAGTPVSHKRKIYLFETDKNADEQRKAE